MTYHPESQSHEVSAITHEHLVLSGLTVGPLIDAMRNEGISEVGGPHRVPFALGTNALFPLVGAAGKEFRRSTVIDARFLPDDPDELEIRFGVAGEQIGRPLLVSSRQKPDTNVLDKADGYPGLVCLVSTTNARKHLSAALYGETSSAGALTPVSLGRPAMLAFLTSMNGPLIKDIRTRNP